jgi:hypothetical protein
VTQGPDAIERAGIKLSPYSDPNFDFASFAAKTLA